MVWARQALGRTHHRGMSDNDLARELKHAAFLLGRLRREADAQAPTPRMRVTTRTASSTTNGSNPRMPPQACAGPWTGSRTRSVPADWISWWRRRYTLTAANALLGALGRLAHGLDADSLILDLDPDDETLAWITDRPRGIGAVELCLRAVSESPELLAMH